MLIVSDTTPIISLIKINHLELLQILFDKVLIPQAVYKELTENSLYMEEAEEVKSCDFLIHEEVRNKESVKILRNVTGLDAGESEALYQFAMEHIEK